MKTMTALFLICVVIAVIIYFLGDKIMELYKGKKSNEIQVKWKEIDHAHIAVFLVQGGTWTQHSKPIPKGDELELEIAIDSAKRLRKSLNA